MGAAKAGSGRIRAFVMLCGTDKAMRQPTAALCLDFSRKGTPAVSGHASDKRQHGPKPALTAMHQAEPANSCHT